MQLIQYLPSYPEISTTLSLNIETFFSALLIVSAIASLSKRYMQRAADNPKSSIQTVPGWLDYCGDFFTVILLAWCIRAFVAQGYYVPTSSLEPTVIPGDVLFVQQYAYGLRLPVIHKKIWATKSPKRGDIALFYWPVNPNIIFVKRVIGLPGDHIVYDQKKLTINGKKINQIKTNQTQPNHIMVDRYIEQGPSKQHGIYIDSMSLPARSINVRVPPGHYFMMGDNRDNSDDSRYWGFVPEKNLIGKAVRILGSWDKQHLHLRMQRFFLHL